MLIERKYGRAIRIMRAARDMTQNELALGAVLDPSYISQIEGEKRKPGMKALDRIAEALGTDVPHLIYLAGPFEDIEPGYYKFFIRKLLEPNEPKTKDTSQH